MSTPTSGPSDSIAPKLNSSRPATPDTGSSAASESDSPNPDAADPLPADAGYPGTRTPDEDSPTHRPRRRPVRRAKRRDRSDQVLAANIDPDIDPASDPDEPSAALQSPAGPERQPTPAEPTAEPGGQPSAERGAEAASSGKGGVWRSLSIPNFRLYFTGNVICQIGNWASRVAQDWLILQLTDDDPVALGIATALQFGPTLLLSMWAGTVADRADKRRLLIWIQVAMAVAGIALGALAWIGVAEIWHVYVAAIIVGVAASFDMPVRSAFVPELVGNAHLTNAVALNSMGFNAARIVGPAVAGVAIAAFDTGPVITVSGLSFLAVIIGLLRIDSSQLRLAPRAPRRRGQTREGLRYVRRRPDLILVMLLLFLIATFGMNFQVTLAIMAKIVFNKDAASYGLLSTTIAIGSLLGAMLSARRIQAPRQRLLLGTALGFGLLQIVLGLVDSYIWLAVLLVPEGILMLAFVNAASSMVQLTTAPAMRGRVMGIYILAFLGGTPFYSPVLGGIAERWGGGAPLVFGGALSALSAIVIGGWLLRTKPVRFRIRVSPIPHLHLHNPLTEDEEHVSETIAHSLQRISGGAKRTVRPAVRIARRAGRAGRSAGARVRRRPRRR